MSCILDQRHVKHIRYGLFSSEYNGCSWVAAYNALYLLGDERDPEKVAKHFEKYLPLGGLFGMPFSSFLKALNDFKVVFKCVSIDSNEMKTSDACILWYRKRNMKAHYCVIRDIDITGIFAYINPTAKAQPLGDFLRSVNAVEAEVIILRVESTK